MKVSELKEGMLLRFKVDRIYKYLQDRGPGSLWFDFGKFDKTKTIRYFKTGRPLMVYLGQEGLSSPSYYGDFTNVRKVYVEGRVAWIQPENWKYVEAV